MIINAQAKTDNFSEPVSEEVKINVYNILKNTPLTFIENQGQIDSIVKYYAKGSGYTLHFTPSEVKFSFVSRALSGAADDKESPKNEKEKFIRVTVAREFISANTEAKIEVQDKCSATVNYFKGNDPAKWRTHIPTYKRIVYKELWKGIDLAFYGENSKLKYEFTVKPGASVENIQFIYKDQYETLIDENGDLIIKTPLGDMTDEKPVSYQIINGDRVNIESNYIAGKENHQTLYGYKMDDYDKNYPLVIDPGIIYSSFLGGSSTDEGNGIAVDQNGNAYVVGYTASTDFPSVNAFQSFGGGYCDAFITKIDATPAIVYSSYLGGSDDDRGYRIAVDQTGNAYITGYTASTDFPSVNALQSFGGGYCDAFITKIDATPAIVYSSYLGGSNEDIGRGIAVDQSGNAYIAGYTASADFPSVNAFQSFGGGFYDAFITKIDAVPTIIYSSYLGGSGNDRGYGVAIDQSGNAYVTGSTASSDFSTINAFQPIYGGGSFDAFITKIDSTPAIVYSSFLGGSGYDEGYGIAVDQSGNAYVAGYTYSTDFPVKNAFQPSHGGGSYDAFVTKIDSTPSVAYSSYLGGSGGDRGHAIAVDRNGNAYVTGSTASTDFPSVNAFQTFGGGDDAFITKIDAVPAIVYSSYLGGSNNDRGYGVAVDQSGNAYVTGYTGSSDFPIVNAFQPSHGGSFDAFVTKIGGPLSLQVNAANLTAVVSG